MITNETTTWAQKIFIWYDQYMHPLIRTAVWIMAFISLTRLFQMSYKLLE